MYAYTSGLCSGSPHSSHSMTVSGSDGSRIVFSASTNGTSATTPANSSGARFVTAPISRPPAEPPRAMIRSLQPDAFMCLATSTKSVNVLRFLVSLPSSYQRRPISPPPRTCAMAKTNPRSSSDSLGTEKPGSIEVS